MNEVSATLMGGVGNYMFQIAAAYAHGKKFNKEVGFNCSESSGCHRHVTDYHKNILKDVNLYFIGQGPRKQFNESVFHYQEIPDYAGSSTLLYGYFQSEKYFKDCEEDIRKMFMSYDIEIDSKTRGLLLNDKSCSIHVRRGDYLKSPNHHPTQDMNYYMKAIKRMPKDSIFLIFSDDIEWCKSNFPDMPEKFKFIEGNSDYEDLYLMAHCKNNIIANSTFSWWAAWLNGNLDKVVVAPNKWFGPAFPNHDTKDLYCEGWVKI